MYGFILKTILPDGRSFISRHKCNDYDDRYYGSGKVVQDFFKSKGLNSQNCPPEKAQRIGVKRVILARAATKEQLDELEKEYKDKPDPFFL
ncbi:hypothetical protein AGMMS49587_04930 [Spirochaetia bacterium]|nr:hypothetical protein AGMMS49587_04930 [Spirochaetia bacterium]